jgi:thioester reductase-like protein
MRQGILLTGATGLVGRYLLCDLLAAGQTVAVLVRGQGGVSAAERVEQLLSFARQSVGARLPVPQVLEGDLTLPGLGLGVAAKRWLASYVGTVLHSAAQVGHQPTPDGEPWQTNVEGTRRLLELCRSLGIESVHHLSTAFVCGDRRGRVHEDELDRGTGPANAYEASKFAAEQLLRQFPGIHATIYRPSVIVGDSRTGYTSSYHHFYRFLELAVRLSARPGPGGRRQQRLPLRLPLTGEETQNLIPVDWIARAVVALMMRPRWHGRTFHLVARKPVPLREIKAFIEDRLKLVGMRWAGPEGVKDPTPLEQLVLEQFKDYWCYLHRNLQFDCRNTQLALPDVPPPVIDRDLMERLLTFALEDRWGRGSTPHARESGCAHYLERVLPEQIRRFVLARAVPAEVVFALEIRGPGGGVWSCRWQGDGVLEVRPGSTAAAGTVFRTHVATFDDLLGGRQTVQSAFFDGHIEMRGDVEQGLKLGVLIGQFLATVVPGWRPATEVARVCVG